MFRFMDMEWLCVGTARLGKPHLEEMEEEWGDVPVIASVVVPEEDSLPGGQPKHKQFSSA